MTQTAYPTHALTGPWEVRPGAADTVFDSSHRPIGRFYARHLESVEGGSGIDFANARMAAAAPELLAALKLYMCGDDRVRVLAETIALDAIDKINCNHNSNPDRGLAYRQYLEDLSEGRPVVTP